MIASRLLQFSGLLLNPGFILFTFSLLGLWLAPAALGRAAWALPAGFAAAASIALFAPAGLHPYSNPWVNLLLSQAPWMLLVLDLLGAGKISGLIRKVPLRALIAFSLFRFLGARYILSAVLGDLSPEFAVEAAAGELLVALGGLALWAAYREGRASRWGYRALLLLWNTYALVASLNLSLRILRADPGFPWAAWARPSRELHAYFTTWPNALDAFFWIPLALGIHAAIFYRLFQPDAAGGVPSAS